MHRLQQDRSDGQRDEQQHRKDRGQNEGEKSAMLHGLMTCACCGENLGRVPRRPVIGAVPKVLAGKAMVGPWTWHDGGRIVPAPAEQWLIPSESLFRSRPRYKRPPH